MRPSRLGPYEIREQLGAGGMGEVYRGFDTELGREVAIKLLPETLSADPERLARLRREARLLASVNHPNVTAIHAVERVDGVSFLVLELVEGRTLAEMLHEGPLPVPEALRIGRDIAEALEAAHGRGIVHRDLKPANVMVDRHDRVKVLDFGVARARRAAVTGDATGVMTEMATLAGPGALVGTAAYMSPEQVRAQHVDQQADIWALGCVLFEMLSGRRAFQRETAADTLSAVLHQDPDWEALPGDVPPPVVALLHRCLEREPRDRMHDVGDVRLELGAVATGTAVGNHVPGSREGSRARPLVWAAVVAAAGAAVVLLVQVSRNPAPSPLGGPPTVAPFLAGEALEDHPAWSPAGATVAYASDEDGSLDIWICDASGASRRNLTPGHEGIDDYPAWSPDGQRIAFFSDRDGGGIFTMPSLGGPATRVAPVKPGSHYTFGLRWNADGRLVFTEFDEAGRKQVYAVAAAGGAVECLTCALATSAEGQQGDLLPGSSWLVFKTSRTGPRGWMLLADGSGGPPEQLFEGVAAPLWQPDGHGVMFVSARDGIADLWELRARRPGDLKQASPRRLTSGLDVSFFALDRTGRRVLAVKRRETAHLWELPQPGRSVVGLEEGRQLTFGDFADARARWLPAGDSFVFQSNRRGSSDIWRYDPVDSALVRLTEDQGMEHRPRPSPAGDWIAFDRDGDGVHLMRPDGGAAHGLGGPLGGTACCADWSPDGSRLVFAPQAADGPALGIATVDRLTGTVTDVRTVAVPGYAPEYPRWSPDGRFIAFESHFEGSWDLWLLNLEDQQSHRLTEDPGGERQAAWSPDGSALYYLDDRQDVWRLPMEANGSPSGSAEPWLVPGTRSVVTNDSLDFRPRGALVSVSRLQSDIWMVEFPER